MDIKSAAKILGGIRSDKKMKSSRENWKKAVESGNLGRKKKIKISLDK